MSDIATYEAEPTLGLLLDRVQTGEEILVTRHGKPIARLVPNSGRQAIDPVAIEAASKRIRERASRVGVKFDFDEFKKDRDHGRL